jgi:hypothetical protein
MMITSQRLSDLKNSTDQCGFTSNPCTWRSMTTSVCWVDEVKVID